MEAAQVDAMEIQPCRPDRNAEACLRLWAAVFEQTLRDASGLTKGGMPTSKTQHEREVFEARNWVMDDSSSFRSLCAVFGFDAERVRESILTRGWRQVGADLLANQLSKRKFEIQ